MVGNEGGGPAKNRTCPRLTRERRRRSPFVSIIRVLLALAKVVGEVVIFEKKNAILAASFFTMSPFQQDPSSLSTEQGNGSNAEAKHAEVMNHHLLQQRHEQLTQGPLPLQSTMMQQQILLAVAQQNAAMALQPAVLALQQAAAASGVALTHNLIPEHLQATALAASLNGTPGHPSALILPQHQSIPLTVQDRPLVPPVYNGVNVNYPGVRIVNAVPPMYVVEHFLSPLECDFLIQAANDSWSPAPVVGKGAGEISASRTSSTCYLAREDLPDYMRKISLLTGKPVEHCELPQVGRYLHTQQYLQVRAF